MALTSPPTTGLPAGLFEAQWGSAVPTELRRARTCKAPGLPPTSLLLTGQVPHITGQRLQPPSICSGRTRLPPPPSPIYHPSVSCGGLAGLTTAWTHPAHPQRHRPPVPMSELRPFCTKPNGGGDPTYGHKTRAGSTQGKEPAVTTGGSGSWSEQRPPERAADTGVMRAQNHEGPGQVCGGGGGGSGLWRFQHEDHPPLTAEHRRRAEGSRGHSLHPVLGPSTVETPGHVLASTALGPPCLQPCSRASALLWVLRGSRQEPRAFGSAGQTRGEVRLCLYWPRGYLRGMKREEWVAPMPGRPCFTGL